MPDWTCAALAKMIDHSLLQPVLTQALPWWYLEVANIFDRKLRHGSFTSQWLRQYWERAGPILWKLAQ